jgi:hypothetical protein
MLVLHACTVHTGEGRLFSRTVRALDESDDDGCGLYPPVLKAAEALWEE